ncbi:nuclear transport factor 2 family protein [Falsigemmobacter faecalis]|uniref:Nuclear transport factor 2 family protein n=1 Tax=Falsigemmobacter faecalis TaxID=2488730 RepID=A0A3P3DGP8_9RHOB|nr:nuclear transport factor 2 family protein [Falsigemmobacter faecalis]RRH73014.1 nuclear transport factor 2 family protein [Falsigemmobacter faecalis]
MAPFRNPDRLTELLDREAIRDCLYSYCRGIDRADEAALRGAYWPDGTDQHGAMASGSVENFFAKCSEAFAKAPRNIHLVSNILIEFQSPARAHVESYFSALQRSGPGQAALTGRYCDVFEKRGEDWRVLHRLVVYDWVETSAAPEEDEASRFGPRGPRGSAFPTDPVYQFNDISG